MRSPLGTNLEDIHADELKKSEERLNSQIIKLAEQYASCDKRSAAINEERAGIRENAEKLGIPSKAFQHAVGFVKHMSEGEQTDYRKGLDRVLTALQGRQAELFPDDHARIQKRVEADRLAREQAEREDGTWSSENPRSDPKRGGAAKVTEEKTKAADAGGEVKRGRGRPPGAKNKPKGGDNVVNLADNRPANMRSSDPVIDASLKSVHEREQAEGAAILADAGKPKAQSQIARDKLAEAGLPGGMH